MDPLTRFDVAEYNGVSMVVVERVGGYSEDGIDRAVQPVSLARRPPRSKVELDLVAFEPASRGIISGCWPDRSTIHSPARGWTG